MRIIISSNDSTLYTFASFLHQIFKDNIPKLISHIQNNYKQVENLNGAQLELKLE